MSRPVGRASISPGRVRRVFFALGAVLFIGSAASCGRNEIDARAELLVRRNLFDGSSMYPIRDARAHQYGSLQVDGLEGGMMYRFEADPSAVDWLVERWSLERIAPGDSAASIPSQVPEGPSWWLPRGSAGLVGYRGELVDPPDGERVVLLLHEPDPGTVFFLEYIRLQSSV